MKRSRIFYGFIALFLIGSFFGILFARVNPSSAEIIFSNLREFLGGNINENMDRFSLFTFIFFNNSRVALISAIGGVLFGIVPAGILFFNGFIVGIVIEYFHLQGEDLLRIVLAILPHGLIEIPAFAVAGVGGVEWYFELVRGEGTLGERFLNGFKKSMKMLAIALVMLLVAAFVEAYITPTIASAV
ncbi:sporulation protein [Thermococcus sp. EP1]|uniref:stage II sporulation protein M n=1 Tax=Thermococcus sp. EP1 TaxID=1591054 RepID=UPI0006DB4D1C|nr:stage II sporulation protein M [Thermococcus sp. EP1]KPU63955.1 sporulation protein [Thermococcus sp. EP1]